MRVLGTKKLKDFNVNYLDTKPVVQRVVGQWYSQEGVVLNTTSHGLNTTGAFRTIPTFLHAGNLDLIGVNIAATAVSTWRLGMYPSNPSTFLPDGQSLLVDAGTVNMASATGIASLSLSVTLALSGIYWLAALAESYTALPNVQGWDNNSASAVSPLVGTPIQFVTNGRLPYVARYAAGLSAGGLPSTCPTLTGWVGNAPRIAVRAA